jgi:hypothetical protein
MSADLHFSPIATFSGLRNVPLFALSRNSINPAFAVGDDGVTIRVVRRHHLPFSEIRRVSVRWRLAYQVTIVPKRGLRTFSANFISKADAIRAAALLRQRGVALDAATVDLVCASVAPP